MNPCSAGGGVFPTADVAEYMPMTEIVTPGTVLVIGDEGKLEVTSLAYDPRVAGIVSTSPGISLGAKEEGNNGEQIIAVAGRVPCRDLREVQGFFDFAFDWELLHHIFPKDRPRYVANVARLLAPGAKYLSVCFHEDDPQFGGSGKYRTTGIGTVLYFSSKEELQDLFSPYFRILELQAITVTGKWGDHLVNYAFLERPGY